MTDPIPTPEPFNPMDPDQIGAMLRRELESREYVDFPPPRFPGAGLYALYYVGDQHYRELVASDREIPVYVGKAEAGNSSYGWAPDYTKPKLADRIRKHASSVGEVEAAGGNLHLSDFRAKYLPLDDAWIVLGERALLRAYRPVLWNTIMNGFGSNEPGTARTNARSVWDTVHPGRPRAGYMPNRGLTLGEMLERIHTGIAISLMPEGEGRRAALQELANSRPSVIWAPAPKRSGDPRLRVGDMERFLSEIERLEIEISEDEYVEVQGDELPVPPDVAPETTTEGEDHG